MARKVSNGSPTSHGVLGDVIGVALLALSLMLVVAQWSFEPKDLEFLFNPPYRPAHNYIGVVGAYMAYGVFFLFGIAGYLLPVLFFFFGLGFLLQFLSYLQRRWAWALILLVCTMGLVELNAPLFEEITNHINTPAGGVVGTVLKRTFSVFGKMGATIVFVTLYAISLLYLTNIRLGEWMRWLIEQYRAKREAAMSDDQKLVRRAKDLKKEVKELQEQAEAIGVLGQDLQPVPEPQVRDLSVPVPAEIAETSKEKKKKKRKSKVENPFQVHPDEEDEPEEDVEEEEDGDDDVEEEEVSDEEPKAASTADIIGGKNARALNRDKGDAGEEDSEDEESEKSAATAKPRAPVRQRPRPIAVAATPTIGNYQLPLMSFFNQPDPQVKPSESKEELMANARLMQKTLEQFKIEVSLGDITKGPTITRYELHPAPGVKLEKIVNLTNNITAALKAERIHILAPVPGKSSVGIEVPNRVKTKVIMRDLMESNEWRNSKARLPIALGKDVYGKPIIADLADMPHLLVAGSTGSGKSVCINSIIASLLYRFPPDRLRFVMIDPKVVELQQYNRLPHLVVPVVTDPKKVVLALRWVVNEMEKRYQIFAKVGVRNISSFNERPAREPEPPKQPELPLDKGEGDGFAVEVDDAIVVPREDDIVIPDHLSYVVVVIDELADLMLVAPADVEMAIARITQMARAAGIHCIVATQRPSVDVITGVIKANIPARIAFQVASRVDSRTILDAMGADKLLGKGDMLYLPPGAARLTRAQGVLITDDELERAVDHIAKQGKPSYEKEIHEQLKRPASGADGGFSSGGNIGVAGPNDDEDLIQRCIEVIRSEQKASVSLLQRRLRLGYTRAARLMDELENRGIVGPSVGAEPREILIDLDGEGHDGAGEELV